MKIKEKASEFWEKNKTSIKAIGYVGVSMGALAGAFIAGAALDHHVIESSWKDLFEFKPELKDIISDARLEYINKMMTED